MQITSISDFRKDMKNYLNKVIKNMEPLIINRGNDEGIVVLSLDEYNILIAKERQLAAKIEEERKDWQSIQVAALNKAYSDDEPEYLLSMVSEPNPDYEAR